MQAALGIIVFVAVAYLFSSNRSAVSWRTVGAGLVLQLILAWLLFNVQVFADGLLALNAVVAAVETASREGTTFVFGYLGGANPPWDVTDPGGMFLFAFRVLPLIIIFSVLVALLWYWRILPFIVRLFGKLLTRLLGVGGAVGTGAAASVFLGIAEAPLVIRAYLERMSRSELFVVMTCAMSTVAGSIMVLYATILRDHIDGALGHIITASVLNVIGAIVIARTLMPPDEQQPTSETGDNLIYRGNMDAITRGTMDGLNLAVTVGAMVLVLVSLVALVNYMLGSVEILGAPLSLERLTGPLFAPIAWLLGVPWSEASAAGSLIASKLILNEVVAYLQMVALPSGTLSPASLMTMTYVLCGFTNFGSLGILIGGLTTLAPKRREEILRTAPLTLLSGTLTATLTGSIVTLTRLIA
ncbi:MAG: nucleoside:proton symporter [Gammaproteobacteria bacterium]|nr:nucleoside:proton symporter [Gammaproteobacteria bacterium]